MPKRRKMAPTVKEELLSKFPGMELATILEFEQWACSTRRRRLPRIHRTGCGAVEKIALPVFP